MLKRNMIANIIGSVWGFALSLLAIPLQIRLLGAEAYGLIGFIAVLQLLLVVWDFGLTSIVIREVAADREAGRAVARTGAAIYWIVALSVGVVVFAASNWIASNWLTVETLAPDYTAGAIRIIAVYLTFTWVISHYANILFGLNRLDVANGLRIFLSSGAQIGGIGVLLVRADLHLLLWWLAAWAVIGVIAHVVALRRLFPELSPLPALSLPVIRRIWKASFDMNVVTTATTIYTQADKVLISALLPLSALGYYNIAYKLTLGIAMIPTAVSSSTLPTLTGLAANGQPAELRAQYNRAAQLVMYLIAGATFGLVFFGRDVIALWTTAATAENAYRVLGLLVISNLLNAATIVSYMTLLAAGKTRRLAWIYLGGLPIYLGALILFTQSGGLEGAALAFGVYSLYLLLTLLPSTQRAINGESAIAWINRIVTPFTLLGAAIFALCRLLIDAAGMGESLLVWIAAGIGGIAYMAIGFWFLYPTTQISVLGLVRSVIGRARKVSL